MKRVSSFLEELSEAFREAGYFVLLALKALCFWHREPPISTIEELVRFAETRSKFVSQITLFGYVKTRAGTRYTSLFEDDLFASSVNIAKWEIYLACLADLAIYMAAKVTEASAAARQEAGTLAVHIFETVVRGEQTPQEKPDGFRAETEAFLTRCQQTDWSSASYRENSFGHSVASLVEWAPIAEELKMRDAEIVKNSMRFRWKTVRDQLDTLLQAETIAAEWQSGRS